MNNEQQEIPDIEDLPIVERVRMLEDALIMLEQRGIAYKTVLEILLPYLPAISKDKVRADLYTKINANDSDAVERGIYIDLYNLIIKEQVEQIPPTLN